MKGQQPKLEINDDLFSFTGFIASILHAKSFIPLSRISYATYLLNPFVVLSILMSSKTPFHLDFFTLVSFNSFDSLLRN